MAFTAKIKLSVDKSNESSFREQIQSFVNSCTERNPIRIKDVALEVDNVEEKIKKIQEQFNKSEGITVKLKNVDAGEAISKLRNDIQKMLSGLSLTGLKEFLSEGVSGDTSDAVGEIKNEFDELDKSAKDTKESIGGVGDTGTQTFKGVSKGSDNATNAIVKYGKRIATLKNQITNFSTSNGKMYRAYKDQIDGWLYTLENLGNAAPEEAAKAIQDIETRFISLKTEMRQTGKAGNSFFETLKKGWQRFGGWSIVTKSMMAAWNTLKKMVTAVKELDSAMTELRKVTDLSDATYSKFLKNAVTMSKDVGASLADTVNATADFARLGYNLEDASALAEAALVYKNVGDGIDSIGEATDSIISTIKAFEKFGVTAQDAMSIVDKFNEVGNKFAITSVGIGTALQKSAAALASAGNNLEESIALITGMNAVLQNPEVVGTTMKTVTMYLRAAKTEAEEAGESTDGMANSVSELREEILKLTNKKVDIMVSDTEFKSTIQIMRELSKEWKNIQDVDRANILELLGGKRNANAVASLLENFKDVEAALSAAYSSTGSAVAENEEYLDSISGKLTKFGAIFESISHNIINSGLAKFLLDVVNLLMTGFEWLSKYPQLLTLVAGAIMIVTSAYSKHRINQIASQANIINIGAEASAYTQLRISIEALTISEKKRLAQKIKNDLISKGATSDAIKQTMANLGLAASYEAVGAGATVASVGMKAFTAAIPVIGWILAGISAIVTVIELGNSMGWFDGFKSSAERAEKALESLKESTEEVSSVSKEFQSLKKSADDIIPRYAELSQGVNKFGENVKLTDEEYAEFLSLNNQIAEMFPQLNMGLDDNGNAMLALSGDADTLTSSLQALLDIERQLANEKIAEQMPSILNDINTYTAEIEKIKTDEGHNLEVLKEYLQLRVVGGNDFLQKPKEGEDVDFSTPDNQVRWVYDDKTKRFSFAQTRYTKEKDTSAGIDEYDQLLEVLNALGIDQTNKQFFQYRDDDGKMLYTNEFAVVGEAAERLKHIIDAGDIAIESYVAGIEKQINSYQNQIDAAWAKLNPVSQAWMSSSYTYQELPEKMKDIANVISSNLDFSKLDIDTSSDEAIQDYINKNIIYPLFEAAEDERINKAFENIFNLQDKLRSGEITTEQFTQTVSKTLNDMFDEIDDEGFEKLFIDSMNKAGIEGRDLIAVIASVVEEWANVGGATDKATESVKTYADIIKGLSDKASAFEAIGKIYTDVSNGGDFDWSSLFADDFVKTFGQYEQAYDNFVHTVTNNSGNITACKDAFNQLVTAMVRGSGVLDDLDESTRDVTIAFLEQKGVSNAKLIVDKQLEYQNELLKYSTEENKRALFDEAAAGTIAQRVLAELCIQELRLNNNGIDSSEKVKSLREIAQQAGATIGSLERLADAELIITEAENIKKKALESKDKGEDFWYEFYTNQATGLFEAASELANQPIEFDSNLLDDVFYDGLFDELSTDTKKVEQYVADIDAYYAANKRLEQIQREKEHINTQIDTLDVSDIDALRNRLALETQLTELYKQEAGAERILIEQRTQGIQTNVERLRELGFEVEYNNETNELFISNLERLNSLTATTQGEYKTLEEATNAYRKEIEELIDDTEALNEANASSQNNLLSLSQSIAESWERVKEVGSDLVSAFSDQLSEVTSAYQSLHTAAKEYNELGYITVDTFQSLMNMESKYLTLLRDESGAIDLNTSAVYRLVSAKMEDLAITKARSLVETIKQNLDNAEALREMADATYDAANANWALVYSELAALGLETDLYDSFKEQIDTIRDLTQSAKNNITNMYDDVETETEEAVEDGTDAIDDYLNELQSALEYTLEKTQELIEYEINQQSKALQDQIDKYKEIIDLKKESLDKSKEESDYEEDVAEKVKEIARLQSEIDRLSLDDSRESRAERNSLIEKLVELQKGLADTQSDHAIENQKEQLDKMADAYEEQKNSEIERLENSISSAEKLYQLTIDRINSSWDTLYDDIISWNEEAGNDINKNITENWEKAAEAVRTYGSYLEAVAAIEGALGGETGEGDNDFEPENINVAGRTQSTNSSTQFVQTPTYTDISFDDMFREKVGGELDDFLVEIRTSLPYVSSAISNAHSVPDIYTDNSTTSTVYEPHIEVTITGSRDMSDMDARQFGEQIADVTLDKLYEAFERKGIGTSVNSRTK